MIERQTINGREATVADFMPGIIKVLFDDGETLFLKSEEPTVRKSDFEQFRKYSEDQPRDDSGKWTDGGGDSRAPGIKAKGQKAAESMRAKWSKEATHQTPEAMIAAAPANQIAMANIMSEVAAESGAEFKDPGSKVKSEKGVARFMEKITGKNAAGEVTGKSRDPSNVVDIIRAGFIVDSPEQAKAVMDGIAKRMPVIDEDWRMNEYKYFDRSAIVRMPDGMMGEVQVMERGLAHAKSESGGGGHNLYVMARKLPDGDPTKIRLTEMQRSLYGRAYDALSASWKHEMAPVLAATVAAIGGHLAGGSGTGGLT